MLSQKLSRTLVVLALLLSFGFNPPTASAATHQITQSQTLSWKATYSVAVNQNKITAVSNLNVSVSVGSFRTSTKILSPTRARITITRQIGPVTAKVNLNIQLSNGKLITSVS